MYIKLVRHYLVKYFLYYFFILPVEKTLKILIFVFSILKTTIIPIKIFLKKAYQKSLNVKKIYNHTVVKILNR